MSQQQERAQKQQFLRSQIAQDLYQDFGEFCFTTIGEVDIDGWTFQYIQNLVGKFKQLQKKQQQQLQEGSMIDKSFHIYQTSQSKDIKGMMEKVKQQQQIKEKQEKQIKAKQKQEKRKRKQQRQKKRKEKQQKKLQKQAKNQLQANKAQQKSKVNDQQQKINLSQQNKNQKQIEEKFITNDKNLNKKQKQKQKPKTTVDVLQSAFKKKNQKIQKTPKQSVNQPNILNQKQFATIQSNDFQIGFQNSNFWGASQTCKDLQVSKKLQQSFATNSHNFFAAMNQKQQQDSQIKKTQQKVLKDQGLSKINMTKGKKAEQCKNKQQTQSKQKNFSKKKNIEEAEKIRQEKIAQKSQSEESSSQSSDQQGSENKQNSQTQNSCIEPSSTSISKHIYRDPNQISKIHMGSSQSKEPHYKQNKLPYQGQKLIKQEFSDKVPCFKATIRQALSHPKFNVVINQHQIIHKNFFVPDYVMYTVKTLPNQIQVKRNYQDFIKLRKALGQVYPGIQLPYLQKIGWLSQTHQDTIKKQKITLQFFLNDIIYNKQLRNSRILEDFLTIKEHKKMKRKFQQYDRLAKLTCIQQLCLLSGHVNVKLNEDQRIYEQKITQYITRMEQYFQRHKKLSQTLQSQYDSIMKTFKSLSGLMLEVEMETSQFNKRVQCNEIRNLQKNYSLLNKFYKQSTQNIGFDLDTLQQKIMPFLRYQKQNIGTLREVIYTRNYMTKSYLKRAQMQKSALANKTQAYTSDKYKQYKNGVSQESKDILVFKYQTAYMNNQVCEQSQRFFELLGNKINYRWAQIGKAYNQKLDQSKVFWKNVIKDRRSCISKNLEQKK